MKEIEEENRDTTTVHLYHKEEAKSRILADTKDRTGLLEKLDTCLHPLDPSEHPGESIVNILSGKIALPVVNVDSAVKIGETMFEDFEKTWPEGFYKTHSEDDGNNSQIHSSGKLQSLWPKCHLFKKGHRTPV